MCAAWGMSEIPRYSMYLVDNLGVSAPSFLKWLRYSAFLVLYPAGITGEIGCIWNSMDYVRENNVWSVSLPNKHNVAYSHYLMLWVMLALYVPGSPTMIGHMLKQRSKKLAEGAIEAGKKAQ